MLSPNCVALSSNVEFKITPTYRDTTDYICRQSAQHVLSILCVTFTYCMVLFLFLDNRFNINSFFLYMAILSIFLMLNRICILKIVAMDTNSFLINNE